MIRCWLLPLKREVVNIWIQINLSINGAYILMEARGNQIGVCFGAPIIEIHGRKAGQTVQLWLFKLYHFGWIALTIHRSSIYNYYYMDSNIYDRLLVWYGYAPSILHVYLNLMIMSPCVFIKLFSKNGNF